MSQNTSINVFNHSMFTGFLREFYTLNLDELEYCKNHT